MNQYKVKEAKLFRRVLDDILYKIFFMKQPNYNMELFST